MKYKILLSIFVGSILIRCMLFPFVEVHNNLILLVDMIPFILSVVLLRRAAASHDKPYKNFWNMLALGSLFFAAANLTWVIYDLMIGMDAPIPSISDIFWILMNFAYVTALVSLLMRDRSIYRNIRFLFDTSIILIITGAVGWEFIIRPHMDYFLGTTGFWGVLVTTAYPTTDLIMLISIFMLYYSNRFPFSKDVFLCIAAGMTVFIAGDTMYLSQVVSGDYEIGSWVDPLFSAAVLLFTIAGIRSVRARPRALPHTRSIVLAPKIKYILPYGCLIMLLALTIQRIDWQTPDLIVVASIITVLLIIIRQVFVLLENDTLMFKLQQALSQAEYLALHDPLSKLPNRRYFEMQTTQALENAGKDQCMAVLFMDFDRFKLINDSYGHNAGDAFIQGIGERIIALTDERHFVSRMGGDEFTILCRPPQTKQELGHFAQRIIEEIERPFQFNNIEFCTGASIGIALFPQDGATFAELLQNADTALYHAKSLGRGRAVFYKDNLKIYGDG